MLVKWIFTRRFCVVALLAIALIATSHSSTCWAGVSGENVIVVVNGDSADSRTLANHYTQLREIPSCNVIVLNDVPQGRRCELDEFQTKMLKPILDQVDARKLAPQIKVIAYSTGFPFSVTIKRHRNRLKIAGLKKVQGPVASVTGLTYFYNHILADGEGYLSLDANLYSRRDFSRNFINPFGSGEDRDAFEEASQLRRDGDFLDAASKFEALFQKQPLQAPLAIRASECYAEHGDYKASAKMLALAVRSGWTSGRYLSDSELLQPTLARPELKNLTDSLQQFPLVSQEPVEFSSLFYWSVNGWPSMNPRDGVRHLMSCMLGAVDPRGSTLDEAILVLRSSAQSDQTFPEGEFWFSNTGDVRSKTRFPGIVNALTWLNSIDKKGRVVRGRVPTETGSIAGLMLGTPVMNLASRRWRFLPGAIADNLTSYGANYETDAQTKMTDLLHCGAVMTSGSVAEPFALQQKFPLPIMYGFYAGGASAIESFYLSIASPYQTLIVGDPVAAPFASVAPDRSGFRIGKNKNEFMVGWKPKKLSDPKSQAVATELYMDGKLLRRSKPERTRNIKVNGVPDGWWPLRLTLLSRDPMRSRSVRTDWIKLGDSIAIPIATPMGRRVRVSCVGASEIALMHHNEVVTKIKGFDDEVDIDPKKWGKGPFRVRPVAIVDGKKVYGKAVVVNVD
jgi:hypothetical protein